MLIFMAINTLTAMIGSYMLRPIINHVAGVDGTGDIADGFISSVTGVFEPFIKMLVGNERATEIIVYLITGIILLAIIYIVGVISTYVQSRIMLTISQSAIERIRNDLFDKIESLPVKFYDTNSTGELMSRFTNDVDNIGTMLDSSIVSLFSGVITLIGTFAMMLYTNLLLTVITIVFVPLFTFGGIYIAKKSRKYYSGQQAALGAANGYIEETVSGQKVIKVFNHEQICEDEFDLLNEDLRGKQFNAQFYGGIMGPIMGNTSQISYAVTAGVGGVLCALTMTGGIAAVSPLALDVGGLTIFASYSRQFSMPINNLSQQMTTIFAALAGAERVFAIMDATPEDPDRTNAKTMDTVKGSVVFENVTFGYNKDKTVLKNISLYAKPGQKIAFVGSTGAGKTTVTNLLNRFYDIDEGSITIDGVD
ncbi:MAG TPA: ABC transporter ATP-binding protein, partial [Bacillota bacterium]|nr:ABC transporter ATP-binding protein [Bacillota bacterium]